MAGYRRILVAARALAVGALAVPAGLWLVVAGRVEASLDRWIEARHAEGLEFTYKQRQIGGFPIRLVLVLNSPALAAADGSLRWEGPTLRATAPVWNWRRIDYDVAGSHRTRAARHGSQMEMTIDMAKAGGRIEVDRRGDVRAGSFHAEGIRSGWGILPLFTAARLDFESRLTPVDEIAAGASMATMALTVESLASVLVTAPTPFNGPVERVALALEVTGPPPWNPASARDAVSRWRDAGGTIEVRELAFDWGGLALTGEGTAALDGEFRPLAAFTLTVVGFEESMRALVQGGAMTPAQADLARRTVVRFSTPPEAAGGSRLVIPVTVQDGVLTLGGQPIAVVPPLTFD